MTNTHQLEDLMPHHRLTIENMLEVLSKQEDILGILLTGSIAHGYAKPSSDVDIAIIVTEESFAKRQISGELTYFNNEMSTYPDGYVDGKVISLSFMEMVAEKGSEPARFAFEGSRILFSKIEGLDDLINRITRYPIENQEAVMAKFYAQIEAWHWYCHEAIKHDNDYLLGHSVSQLLLFSGRLILAHNQKLFPYHKWFVKAVESATHKPTDYMEKMNALLKDKNAETINGFFEMVKGYQKWQPDDFNWPNQFVVDSEQNWLTGPAPVGDL